MSIRSLEAASYAAWPNTARVAHLECIPIGFACPPWHRYVRWRAGTRVHGKKGRVRQRATAPPQAKDIATASGAVGTVLCICNGAGHMRRPRRRARSLIVEPPRAAWFKSDAARVSTQVRGRAGRGRKTRQASTGSVQPIDTRGSSGYQAAQPGEAPVGEVHASGARMPIARNGCDGPTLAGSSDESRCDLVTEASPGTLRVSPREMEHPDDRDFRARCGWNGETVEAGRSA